MVVATTWPKARGDSERGSHVLAHKIHRYQNAQGGRLRYPERVPMRDARHAVVLLFDDTTARAVRTLTEQLHVLPHTVAPAAVPPHVTLAVCTGLDVSGSEAILRQHVEATRALECTLASVGIFSTPEGVIYLGVTPGPRLVVLQAQVVDCLRAIGAGVGRYWIPGQWMPHCTLAAGVPVELIPDAVARVINAFAPRTSVLTRMSVIEMESVQVCYTFELPPARS